MAGPPLPGNHSPLFAPVPKPTIQTGVTAMTLAVLSAFDQRARGQYRLCHSVVIASEANRNPCLSPAARLDCFVDCALLANDGVESDRKNKIIF